MNKLKSKWFINQRRNIIDFNKSKASIALLVILLRYSGFTLLRQVVN